MLKVKHQELPRQPFLFRFKEIEPFRRGQPVYASPESGGESNPKEEAPPKEPSKKTPWGD